LPSGFSEASGHHEPCEWIDQVTQRARGCEASPLHPNAVRAGKLRQLANQPGVDKSRTYSWTPNGRLNIKLILRNKNSLAQVCEQAYCKTMLGKERIFTGMNDEFLNNHGANTELGRIIRSADAKRVLEEMQVYEESVQSRERAALECQNRIDAMLEQHRLSAEYLISFGVSVEHRNELRRVLDEVSRTGGLSLKSAIEFANARAAAGDLQLEG
jgi:hypothetical protein